MANEESAEAWYNHLKKDEAEARKDPEAWAEYQGNLYAELWKLNKSLNKRKDILDNIIEREYEGDGWMDLPDWRH